MSSEIETRIKAKGTREELLRVLDVLEQYTDRWNNNWFLYRWFDLEKLRENLQDQDNLDIVYDGPYGKWPKDEIDSVDLFERIADASPSCRISGLITSESLSYNWLQAAKGKLIGGKLLLASVSYTGDFYYDDEEDEEDEITLTELKRELRSAPWERLYDPQTKAYTDFITIEKVLKSGKKKSVCKGENFSVSGKFVLFDSGKDLTKYIEACEGKVSGSVSKNTDYFIVSDYSVQNSKLSKAKELGIKIISEMEFFEMIRNRI